MSGFAGRRERWEKHENKLARIHPDRRIQENRSNWTRFFLLRSHSFAAARDAVRCPTDGQRALLGRRRPPFPPAARGSPTWGNWAPLIQNLNVVVTLLQQHHLRCPSPQGVQSNGLIVDSDEKSWVPKNAQTQNVARLRLGSSNQRLCRLTNAKSIKILVDLKGFEPLTSSMPW